jgi:hypothetical protein
MHVSAPSLGFESLACGWQYGRRSDRRFGSGMNDTNDGGEGNYDVVTECCYDGTKAPVQIEDIEHAHGAAVTSALSKATAHVIRVDDRGLLVVESPGTGDGHARIDM